jgi:type III secretion protein V
MLTGVLVAIIALMIVPLPIVAIDTLVAVNIACGAILLLLAVYIGSPLEFSVFPSVLLITTLFRLALAIATTRMILLHGNAGHIIDTFGHMVAGGNLVVGLVVFLIITVVQFIVIAKGAERVAEVAARFSLDAMPGKQLSIDSDLRSGLIDKDEAKKRRKVLELESKLHGSLDGAMKFVKGDSIAGIVIIVINLLGGLTIGVMQQGMSVTDAVLKYSILTIGDGMVSQIPALLGAMAAGLIVTRATDGDGDGDQNLGGAIGRQVASKPRVLLLAAGLCLLMAIVPGFPAFAFISLALILGGAGVLLTPTLRMKLMDRFGDKLQPLRKRALVQDSSVLQTHAALQRATVALLLEIPSYGVSPNIDARLVAALEQVLDYFQLTLGLSLPRIVVHRVDSLLNGPAATAIPVVVPSPEWRLLAYEVPLAVGALPLTDTVDALADAVKYVLRRHVGLFLGIQETHQWISRSSVEYPDLVRETLRVLPITRVAEILRKLVEEEVPIRNTRDILETLAEAAQREKDVNTLAEIARIALRRHLSYRVAPTGHLPALGLQLELEEVLRKSLRVNGGVQQLALEKSQVSLLRQNIKELIERHKPAAVVTAIDIRKQFRKMIEIDNFDTPVLSFHELMPEIDLSVIARIPLEALSDRHKLMIA